MSATLTPPNFSPAASFSAKSTGSERLLTLEEFEEMDNRGFELVDGRLVEKGMGWKASAIGAEITSRLDVYCGTRKLGKVFNSECGYRLFAGRTKHIRKPDVSFVAASRAPKSTDPDGWLNLVPDLAVEVISTHDKATKLREKLTEYREAGIPIVWVAWPESKTVDIYRVGASAETVGIDGVLTGEPVLPGFTLSVAELFAE